MQLYLFNERGSDKSKMIGGFKVTNRCKSGDQQTGQTRQKLITVIWKLSKVKSDQQMHKQT